MHKSITGKLNTQKILKLTYQAPKHAHTVNNPINLHAALQIIIIIISISVVKF